MVRTSRGPVPFLVLAAFFGSAAALYAIWRTGDTFGFPGSRDYEIYERFNRAMAVLILLEGGALIAAYLQFRDLLNRTGRVSFLLSMGFWLGMSLGTAAEFWLFSDQPYGENNLRSAAFTLFSLSDLLVMVLFLILGVTLLRLKVTPFWLAAALAVYPALSIGLFLSGQSVFLAPSLVALAITAGSLVGVRGSPGRRHSPDMGGVKDG